MSTIILDIETRPSSELEEIFVSDIKVPGNLKDPEKIKAAIAVKMEEAQKDMATDPDYNEIVCIGLRNVERQESVLLTLAEFAEWINKETKLENGEKTSNLYHHFITFNGKAFDFPTIIRSGIKEGMALPYKRLFEMCDKYKTKNHTDLMQELTIGYGKFKSLDKYIQIYLGVAKEPIDFTTATDEEIKEHCREDLTNTEKLYKKFEMLFV